MPRCRVAEEIAYCPRSSESQSDITDMFVIDATLPFKIESETNERVFQKMEEERERDCERHSVCVCQAHPQREGKR